MRKYTIQYKEIIIPVKFCFIHLVEPGLLGREKIRWWENNGSDLIGVKMEILENFGVQQQKCRAHCVPSKIKSWYVKQF